MDFDFIKKLFSGANQKVFAILTIVVISVILLISLYGSGTTDNNDNSEFESILSKIEGAGETKAYITYYDNNNSTNDVKGIIIVSRGAGDIGVRLDLQQAAATAYAVSADKIEIYEMKEGE